MLDAAYVIQIKAHICKIIFKVHLKKGYFIFHISGFTGLSGRNDNFYFEHARLM